MMTTQKKNGVGVVIALISAMVTQAQSPPVLLPFQGYLTDSAGAALSASNRWVQFKIFDAPVGGTTVWAGETHRLSVNDGRVNTILGTKVALDGVLFSQTLFLEMTVDANGDDRIAANDPPLLPRQVIIPAVFSMGARGLLTKDAGGNDVIEGFGAILTEDNIETGRIQPGLIGNGTITNDKISSLDGTKVVAKSLPLDRVDWESGQPTIPGKLLNDGSVSLAKLRAPSLVPPVGDAPQEAPLGDIAESLSIEEWKVTSADGIWHDVTETRLRLRTQGRPVFVQLTASEPIPGRGNTSRIGLTVQAGNNHNRVNLKIRLVRVSALGQEQIIGRPYTFHLNGGVAIDYPASLSWIDASAPAGSNSYFLRVETGFNTSDGGATTGLLNGCRLIAYEK